MATGIYNDEECGALPCPPEGCPSNRVSCTFPNSSGGTKTVCCKHGCLAQPIPVPGQNGVRYCKCPGEQGAPQDDQNPNTGNYCPGTRGCCKPGEYCCGSNCCTNGCKNSDQPQLGCACQEGQTACGRHCCKTATEQCITPEVGSPFCCAGEVCGSTCCKDGCATHPWTGAKLTTCKIGCRPNVPCQPVTVRLRNRYAGGFCSYLGDAASIKSETCPGLCSTYACSEINYRFSCEAKQSGPICSEEKCKGWGEWEDPDVKTFLGMTPQQVIMMEGFGHCPITYDAPWSASNPPNCNSCNPN
jgi:hypothetical protein